MQASVYRGRIRLTFPDDLNKDAVLAIQEKLALEIGSIRVVDNHPRELSCAFSITNFKKLKRHGCSLAPESSVRKLVANLRQRYDDYLAESKRGDAAKAGALLVNGYEFKKKPYPHQIIGFQFLHSMPRVALFGDCGTGKSIHSSTPILTPTGWKPIGSISIGDMVFGRDGRPYPVTGVYPQGKISLHRVSFNDGSSILASDDHLWLVQTFNDSQRSKPWRMMSTSEIRSAGLRYGKRRQSFRWRIPIVEPIQFPESNLPINPYVLGVALSTAPEINLVGCRSWERHIHTQYLFSSEQQRLELLRGLLGGTGSNSSTIEFSSPSENLAKDVAFLVRSLGGQAKLSTKGKKKIGRPSYRVHLSLPPEIKAFHLTRKEKQHSHKIVKTITSITPAGEGDAVCITVDSPDRTYVCDNFVVTHNTFIVLTYADSQLKFGVPMAYVVICPVNLIQHVWIEDAATFSDLNVVGLREPTAVSYLGEDWDDPKDGDLDRFARAALRNSRKKEEGDSWRKKAKRRAQARYKKKLDARFGVDADMYVINPENLRTDAKEKRVLDLCRRLAKEGKEICLIIDESSKVKSRNSRTYKALKRIRSFASNCIIMTGTPSPNGLLDLWAQFDILDGGLTLQPNFVDYRRDVCKETILRNVTYEDSQGIKRNVVTWGPKAGAAHMVHDIIKPRMIRFRTEDCIDLPPQRFMIRYVDMTVDQAAFYQEMEERLFAEIEGEPVTAKVAVAKLMKLREVTGGFVITDDKKSVPFNKDSAKMLELDILLEQSIGERMGDSGPPRKAVVWAQYKWECKTLVKRYHHEYGARGLFGGISSGVKDRSIRDFLNSPDTRVLVCHPKSAAHGLTFVVANHSFYYSMSYDYEEFYQSYRRLTRPGQNRPMTAWFLVVPNTIDEELIDAIRSKKDLSDIVTDGEFNRGQFLDYRGSLGGQLDLKL